MRTRFLTTGFVALLTIGFVFATLEVSAQSSTRRGSSVPEKSTNSATSGRNYNDHISNVNVGQKDRPNGNVNVPSNKPKNDSNKPDNNRFDKNKSNSFDNKKPDNNKYNGNRGSVNPPKVSSNPPKVNNNPKKDNKKPSNYTPPRYNRNDPNRHLGYTPFKDSRIIHRPEPYRNAFDFGVRYSTRPSAAVKVRFGNLTLYFSSGVWYNYSNGYYTVYRPPVGTLIPYNNIANDLYYVDFEMSMDYGTTYYVDSYANFYMPVRNFKTYGNTMNLEVVNAPIGAILYDLPSDYREIVRNGVIYYVVGNSVFEYMYSTYNSWYFRCIGVYM